MAILIQIICLMLILGMAFSWPYPLVLERHVPITYVHTSVEEGSAPSSSLFGEMNRMLAGMHESFEHMFGWPTFPTDIYNHDYDLLNDYDEKLNLPGILFNNENRLQVIDDSANIQQKLDAVQPVCTTVAELPTTISPRKSRRKKLPITQTTTCIKELILNGQKHFSEEVTTTDDKGVVIKHSKSYGAISVDTNQIQL